MHWYVFSVYMSHTLDSLAIDTNECYLGIDACDGNATCNNTEGSYECVCNSGFSGTGLSCESKKKAHLSILCLSQIFPQILMSVLLGVFAMRMQSVWTHQAAMSVPASLATLVMDIHVRTLMSVLLILAMRMQLVLTIMGASPVSATKDFQGMEPIVKVCARL